jgi:hypothetical protein
LYFGALSELRGQFLTLLIKLLRIG